MIRPKLLKLAVWWLAACEPTTAPHALATDSHPASGVLLAPSITSGRAAQQALPLTERTPAKDVANVRARDEAPATSPAGIALPRATARQESVSPPAVDVQPKSSKVRLVQGPIQTGEGYRTYLQVQLPAIEGTALNVEVVLEPQAPFKCNEQYPYRLYAIQGEGASTAAEARSARVAPERTVLTTTVTPTRSGEATVSGTFAFSVCTDEKCLIEKAALSVAFEVTPPPRGQVTEDSNGP